MVKNRQAIRLKKRSILILILITVLCVSIIIMKKEQFRQKKGQFSRGAAFATHWMEKEFFLLPLYLNSDEAERNLSKQLQNTIYSQILYFQYAKENQEKTSQEDARLAELIIIQEGLDEETKNIDEESLDYDENALHIEQNMLDEMKRENSLHNNVSESENNAIKEYSLMTMKPEYPIFSYDWSEEWNYEKMISNFYAVDKSTYLSQEYMDIEKLLKMNLAVDQTVEAPQILIYHTHSREAFEDSIPGDASTTIVGAGEKLANLLSNEYGFRVLHHIAEYDTERSEAYAVALPEIEKLLKENPSIEVVIDLHRDEMTGGRKLVMDIGGRPTARFMFFNGLSYSKKNGEITYLENPYIEENLALSFQAQVAANEYYPGIARKIYLKAYRYNMHLVPKSMLIELGAQNNTVEEIMNACDPLAHILSIVLDERL